MITKITYFLNLLKKCVYCKKKNNIYELQVGRSFVQGNDRSFTGTNVTEQNEQSKKVFIFK